MVMGDVLEKVGGGDTERESKEMNFMGRKPRS